MRIARPDDLTDLATLGLGLAGGRRLLAGVQREIVAAQGRLHAARRPECRGCGAACRVKDYRHHAVATPFGQVAVRLPRFRCAGCATTERGVAWPPHVRSTPELDRLRAQLSALMPDRTATGQRQVFGAVARTDTDPAALIRRGLEAIGHTGGTALTAFTDGCPGLRHILLDAGIDGLPILDWFHVAMRLRHLAQVAGGLSSAGPERAAAKAAVVEEVERLRWRLWNGKAKDAKVSIDRIRAVMRHFRGERGGRGSVAPSRRLWTALRALDGYLVGRSDRLVDYGERHRAGLRVGTALTEGTANFLVNRRMAKSLQMRWSRRGADRLLQVRCAVYNGTLGTGFGQRFGTANDSLPPVAAAA